MPSELVTAINRLADEVKRYNDRIDPKRVKGVEFGKAQYGDIEERETGEALQELFPTEPRRRRRTQRHEES